MKNTYRLNTHGENMLKLYTLQVITLWLLLQIAYSDIKNGQLL
jgi:hypothetical protein